ncbi:uncharacterized protein MONBRDRAFT_33848 [Monosiga brevicollis MX1]|uniref:P-type domain-containing protein n=1 Tax=Monosiga brevicollis TaxID=81824 RepID=A9V7W8_MONBE|nr:uncharacterized protein MONBRDRAFT_33848 [Monosiga brevicollis MX1]EDQ86449.1 predicted protein [Monosiga brevicollis MX1]|eukprot:XP_001748839.1 hypothetical protein [Monosiga brevicollis MX1]
MAVVVMVVGLPGWRAGARPLATCSSVSTRADCGYAGITVQLCEQRGCCYDPARAPLSPLGAHSELEWAFMDAAEKDAPSCFYPGDAVTIRKVHVVQSNHFDAGYADLTVNIVNEYFDTYFPRAAQVGAALAQSNSSAQLRWLTHSYLISLYFDCPANAGLHCPSEANKTLVENAIRAGYIYWHALPHNLETALLTPEMLTFAIRMTHDLDDRFNVSHKTVYSQRDVPGMTRSLIPVFAANGLKGVSEGSNSRVFPVNVPPAFLWRDVATETEIIALWHAYDYGQLPSAGDSSPARDYVVVPGLDEAIIYAWRGDNAGPPMSTLEVESNWAEIAAIFPGAEIVSSTLDAYIDVLDKHRDNLPVITQDLTDTWLMGVPSDPIKTAEMRAIHRVQAFCERAQTCDYSTDAKLYDFLRLAIKNSEHTWGLHVQSYGPYQDHGYSNAEFHADILAGNNSYYTTLASSWTEQRKFGFDLPLAALQGSPVEAAFREELRAVPAQAPSLAGFSPVANLSLSKVGGWLTMRFSAANGALVALLDETTGTTFADDQHQLGTLLYQTLTDDDFASELRDSYLRAGTGGENEYGKPGCNESQGCVSQKASPNLQKILYNAEQSAVIVQTTFAEELHTAFGAPSSAWIVYNASRNGVLTSRVLLFNKTSTRYPEALYFGFDPTGNDVPTGSDIWVMDKLGQLVDVTDVAMGGGRGLQAVLSGVTYQSAQESVRMFIETVDAPIVSWGGATPFPTPLVDSPDLSLGANFLLLANPWNTNYPFWFPFVNSTESPRGLYCDLQFRFALHLH